MLHTTFDASPYAPVTHTATNAPPGVTNIFLEARSHTKWFADDGKAAIGSSITGETLTSHRPDGRHGMELRGTAVAMDDTGRKFFSAANVDLLRTMLCRSVIEKFYRQDGPEMGALAARNIHPAAHSVGHMHVVMRSIYIQWNSRVTGSVDEQVRALNSRVLADQVEKMYGQAGMYLVYQRDSSRMMVPVGDRPVYTSTYGTKLGMTTDKLF